MDKKSILSEIKKLINFSKEEKFIDAKSGDIIVRVEGEEFATKLPLLIVTPDGVIPAEDGDYTLEDGRVLTVVGGLIDSIAEALTEEVKEEEVVEEMEEEVVEEVVEDKEEDLEEEVKDKVEERVTELEKKIEEMEALFTEMLSTTKATAEFSKVVEDKIENFIKGTPAELEFKGVKSGYTSVKEENKSKYSTGIESIRNLRIKK
jgi:hypothetical protein